MAGGAGGDGKVVAQGEDRRAWVGLGGGGKKGPNKETQRNTKNGGRRHEGHEDDDWQQTGQ
jgi:hypothetical protein